MIKLKNILSEAYAWERQAGKALPTLAEVQAAYQAKMREDAAIDPEDADHEYEEPPYDPDRRIPDDTYIGDDTWYDKDYDGDNDPEPEKWSKDKLEPEPEPYDPNNEEDEDDDYYMDEAKAAKDYDGDGEIESGSEEYLGSVDKAIKAAADTTAYGNYVNKDRAKSQLTNKDVDVYGIDDSGKGHKITNASELNLYSKFTIKSKNNSKSLEESFKKRMIGNLKGSEYILSETFKRK